MENYETPKKLLQSETNFENPPSAVGINILTNGTNLSSHHSNENKRSAFNTFPVIQTPPSRGGKIINPFEIHMAERFRFPFIHSPSLFHLPSTPRNNSSNFEWTIDDVSHLRPANVQVDESQFLITQDPTLEAEVQEAIKTFFNETDIVPSPVERNSVHQRRVLFNEEESVDSNVLGTQSEIKTRMRDSSSQTILSLPPNLPKEVLDVLKPYFSFNDDQQTEIRNSDAERKIAYIDRDASLRRKLFDVFARDSSGSLSSNESLNRIHNMTLSPALMLTPDMTEKNLARTSVIRYSGSPIEGGKNISICSISPISDGNLSAENVVIGYIDPKIEISNTYKSGSKRFKNSIDESSFENAMMQDSLFKAEYYDEPDNDKENIMTNAIAECAASKGRKESEMLIDSSSSRMEYPTTPLRSDKNSKTSRKNLSLSFNHYIKNRVFDSDEDASNDNVSASLNQVDSGFNEYNFNPNHNKYDKFDFDISMRSDGPLCSTPSKKLNI